MRLTRPQVCYALSAVVFRAGGLSVSGLALLHQPLGIARGALERVAMQRRAFRENLRRIRAVYADTDVPEEDAEDAAASGRGAVHVRGERACP